MDMTAHPLEKIVGLYVETRDRIEDIKQAQAEQLIPYQEAMGQLAIELDRRMEESGATSLKTNAGTASRRITRTATCGDWEALGAWIIANKRLDVLPKKLNVTPFNEMADAEMPMPPGVVLQQSYSLSVRRPTTRSAPLSST
jgi:DNA-binding LacI/PurR family transcriptional regulator